MATYNCASKVALTIESVLSQKQDLCEFIVLDGGSTDGTLEVLQQYQGQVTFISEKDRGVYDAYNKGIDFASGKYLYFLGAGDCLRKGILEQLEEMMPDKPATIVYGITYFAKSEIYYLCEFSKSGLRTGNVCHQSVFYERTIFDLVGKYDLKYPLLADWALNLKCLSTEGVQQKYVPQVIADFEEGGISERLYDHTFRSEFPQLVKKHLGLGQFCLYKIDVARAYLKSYKSNTLMQAPANAEITFPLPRRWFPLHVLGKKTNKKSGSDNL